MTIHFTLSGTRERRRRNKLHSPIAALLRGEASVGGKGDHSSSMGGIEGSRITIRFAVPDISVEAVVILICIVVTLFAPWSETLAWFAPLALGDPGAATP